MGKLKELDLRYLIWDFSHFIMNNIVNRIPFFFIRKIIYTKIYKMIIGEDSYISLGVKILSPWRIVIGKNTLINSGCFLDGRFGLFIEDNVDIAWNTFIITTKHNYDDPEYKADGLPVRIMERACLATRSTVLPGVVIGRGAVVASGAMVTHNVDPFTIVAGVPARKIKDRSTKQKYILLRGIWHYRQGANEQ